MSSPEGSGKNVTGGAKLCVEVVPLPKSHLKVAFVREVEVFTKFSNKGPQPSVALCVKAAATFCWVLKV